MNLRQSTKEKCGLSLPVITLKSLVEEEASMKIRRLLIVEDEPDIREFLADRAAVIGAQVTLAANGKEALELVQSRSFEAVLSDIKMPIMTGLELLQRLRELGNNVPFVILTAFGDKTMVIDALKLGAFDFIDKPCLDENLFKTLNSALELGAEMNFWHKDPGVLASLLTLGKDNSSKAIAELERIYSLVKHKGA
jgi:two-component system response regulator AtoC